MILFSKIDLLGVPATLNFFGDEKRRSNFGGICSILFVGFVAWSIYNSCLDLVNRTNPKITLSEVNVEDPKAINVSLDDFPVAFIVQGSAAIGGGGFTNESIYTLKVDHKVIERVLQPYGSYKKVTTKTPLNVEKCTVEYFGEYASSFTSFTFLGSYCISKNQTGLEGLKMQGIYSSTVYHAITATVVRCDPNNTRVQCGTDAEIKRALSGSYFNAVYMDSMMNVQNYSNPNAKYRELYTTLMNPASYKQVTIYVGEVEMKTDSGILVESVQSETTLKVSTTTEIADQNPNTSGNLLFCAFQSSRTETYITRSYKKIPTVLAEVGSLANAFLGLLLIFISPYLRLKSREALMNELFDVEGKLANQRKLNQRKSDFYERHRDSTGNIPRKVTIEENQDQKSKRKPKDLRLAALKKTVAADAILSKDTFLIYPNEIQETPRSSLTSRSNRALIDKQEQRKSSMAYPESIYTQRMMSENYKLTRTDGDKFEDKEFDQMDYKSEEFEDDIEKQLKNIDTIREKERTLPEVIELEKVDILDTPLSDDRIVSCSDRESRTEQDKEKSPNNTDIKTKRRGALKNMYQPAIKESPKIEKVSKSNGELHIWEYMLSLIYKPKSLKAKIAMIEEGVKKIEEKLDLNNILKKFYEVDKLKTLLLDRDQLELFNNMPKPQLQNQMRDDHFESNFERDLWKKITTQAKTLKNEDYIQMAYESIRQKLSKSDIDQKLIDMFKDKFA